MRRDASTAGRMGQRRRSGSKTPWGVNLAGCWCWAAALYALLVVWCRWARLLGRVRNRVYRGSGPGCIIHDRFGDPAGRRPPALVCCASCREAVSCQRDVRQSRGGDVGDVVCPEQRRSARCAQQRCQRHRDRPIADSPADRSIAPAGIMSEWVERDALLRQGWCEPGECQPPPPPHPPGQYRP